MRTRSLITFILWIVLAAPLAFAAPGDPPPPVEEGLLDCSLYRYGDRFDVAVEGVMKRMKVATDTDATLRAAFNGKTRQDITQRLYQLAMLQGVPGCTQPVVRGFAGNGQIELEIQALQETVCDNLVSSYKLRLGGMRVEPLHMPSKESRCGAPRNPVPSLLTLGGLTQAGRSLPGENIVTVVAQGPFAAPPPVVTRPTQTPACPTSEGQGDPKVEGMLAKQSHVEFDFAKDWVDESCLDILGGESSTGLTCNVATWNRQQENLYNEFERIMVPAEASGDTERIYSAAYWLIQKNDPMRLTILSFDYQGQDCDAIRNRIITAWGLCMWGEVKDFLGLKALSGGAGKVNLRDEVLENVWPCFTEVPENYKDANDFLNDWFRPMPAPEKRRQVLAKVQQRVRRAMAKSGYGDCPYYSDAVLRLDKTIWRDQYRNNIEQLPIDWDHDFWKSAKRCAAQPW